MAINTRQKTVKIKLKNGNIREKKITQYRFNTYYTDGSGARKRKASKWFDSKEECEKAEYEAVHFSPEALKNAKDAVRAASEKMENARSIFGECNVKEASAKQRYDAAGKNNSSRV